VLESPSSRLVLSIDGDIAILHRLGHELRNQGFVTANAATRADALRRARGLHPDIITLDLLSPGLDSFDLLRALHESEATRHIPVALVSVRLAAGTAELKDSIAFVGRPVDSAALAAAIDQAASVHSPRTVLAVGDPDLIEAVRHSLRGRADVQVIGAGSPEEADTQAPDLFPDLLVLDTATAPGTAAGRWVARHKALRPGARLSVIAIVDEEILAGDVQPLRPFGAGPLPLDRMGAELRERLKEHSALAAA